MIRVLIVDDSAIVRRVLTDELSRFADIEVVGGAADPYIAREMIAELHPDVLTLDLAMPRMDGLSFLSKLMEFHPMPVVVVSSIARESSANALRALELGAVEVVSKPGDAYSTPDVPGVLIRAIRAAGSATASRAIPSHFPATFNGDLSGGIPSSLIGRLTGAHDRIIAIGASTGGTRALTAILAMLPGTTPGTLIVQHMPAGFTAAFARQLNDCGDMTVREAQTGDRIVPGVALLSPSNRHLTVQNDESGLVVRLKDGPPVHYQRPSVDVLFNSLAAIAGRRLTGVLLTGMGSDGAKGLLALRDAGAHTIVESEETAIVFGMPKEAIRLGAAIEILPLPRIATAIVRAVVTA